MCNYDYSNVRFYVSAYAAETPDASASHAASNRSEVGTYAQTFKANRLSIEKLMNRNTQLMKQITVLQHELKQSGALDSNADAALAGMSEKIQAQRQAIADARFKVSALKATGDKYLDEKDYDSAKLILETVSSVQDEQISLQRGLGDLLQEKLDILNIYAGSASSDNNTDTDADTDSTADDSSADINADDDSVSDSIDIPSYDDSDATSF